MINAFIFSKNRAAQLRLLLQSFAINAPDVFCPYVLYKADNEAYQVGYDKLRLECQEWFDDQVWKYERSSIKEEFELALKYCNANIGPCCSGLCCMFTDDCIAYRPFPNNFCEDVESEFFLNDKLICCSLRLGYNTTIQNHRTGETHPPIEGKEKHDYVLWNARRYHHHSNPGYIYGQDGCIFRAIDLFKELSYFEELNSFRAFEGKLSEPARQMIKGKTLMMSPKESLVVNFPLNAVQAEAYGTTPLRVVTPEELNNRYLANEVIDLRSFDFSNVIGAHQEFDFKFKKDE